MKHTTVIGFDFGMKYIGVAVGQTVTCTATPLASIEAKNGIPKWEKITSLIEHWHPDLFMVGMPFALDGSKQSITYAVQKFIGSLSQRYIIPVQAVDERFTTQEARQCLFEKGGFRALNKSNIDGFSAKIIIECGLKDIH